MIKKQTKKLNKKQPQKIKISTLQKIVNEAYGAKEEIWLKRFVIAVGKKLKGNLCQ